MPKLKVDGAELHYQDTGQGPPVVFAHGLLWSSSMFRFQVAELSSRYRCIAFDFRGQGQSEVTRSGYDMDTLARDVAQLIEKLGAAPAHFVGLSMGGFIGMRLAARRRELLRSLVLMETAADREPRLNVPKYTLMTLLGRLFGFGPLVGEVMKIMFARPFLEDPSRTALREEMRQSLLANNVKGTARAVNGVVFRRDVEDELCKIGLPTLVISGELDAAVVPLRSRRTAALIPGAKFAAIPRAGHTSTLEEPAAVNAALSSFLDAQAR